MNPPSHAHPGRRGFTLLEVLVAISILMIVTVTLYRFVDTTLRAAAFSEKSGAEDAALNGLRRLVASQLAALPANQDSTLIGMSVGRGGTRRDALQMVCPAGNAVLTPDARGFYQVTLDVREQPRGSGRYALGLERQPWADDDEDGDTEDEHRTEASELKTVASAFNRAHLPADWVKLMDNVSGLEVAYFDARLNGWVDKWTDPRALPNLVRVRLGIAGRADPYEIVERVPGGGVQRTVLSPVTAVNPTARIAPNGGAQANVPAAPETLRPMPGPFNTNPATTAPPPFRPRPIPGNTNPAFGGSRN